LRKSHSKVSEVSKKIDKYYLLKFGSNNVIMILNLMV